ncbi:MAG TPA: hypothetical protein DCG37_07630, partial [Lachnospiraceae bacterium]|nr:hypothetical protein [Lachnospiraceae bacterium]
PIRHGDSVTIANEVAVMERIPQMIFDCKQGGTAYNTSLVFRSRKAGVSYCCGDTLQYVRRRQQVLHTQITARIKKEENK